MNTQLHSLIERQRQRMGELREDASDLANTVADEVWDRFEIDVEEITTDMLHVRFGHEHANGAFQHAGTKL